MTRTYPAHRTERFGGELSRGGEPWRRHAQPSVSIPSIVHNMCMFSERFQILISVEQRTRLQQESKARDISIAALVREAIDSRFGHVSREQKIRAAEEIAAMGSEGDVALSPEEINVIIAEERDANFPELDPPPS